MIYLDIKIDIKFNTKDRLSRETEGTGPMTSGNLLIIGTVPHPAEWLPF
jgi:hypothetical protein